MKSNVKEAITKPEVSFMVSILSPILAVAITLAVMGNRLETLEKRFDYLGGEYAKRVTKVDMELSGQKDTFTTIKIQLAEIQKDILYIKDKVK